MKRKEFLSALGLGAVAITCASCLGGGCKPLDSVPTAPTNVDFTISLTDPRYSALNNNGGFAYKDGLIIARTSSGKYWAVSSVCTHAGGTVTFVASNNQFYCASHGSVFAVDGSVLSGPAPSSLAQYKTSLSGNSLRVYS